MLCRSAGQNTALSSASFLDQQHSDSAKRPFEPLPQHRPTNPQHISHIVASTDQDLHGLIDRFFEAQGSVLPYVDKYALSFNGARSLLESFHNSSNAKKALLNIMFAHAALAKSFPDAEAFYRRTLALLDGLSLRGSSLELGMWEYLTENPSTYAVR
jgi:hypothetical protein